MVRTYKPKAKTPKKPESEMQLSRFQRVAKLLLTGFTDKQGHYDADKAVVEQDRVTILLRNGKVLVVENGTIVSPPDYPDVFDLSLETELNARTTDLMRLKKISADERSAFWTEWAKRTEDDRLLNLKWMAEKLGFRLVHREKSKD
jgi:hypothetical protein